MPTSLIHYKYSIGDRVILKELPQQYRAYGAWNYKYKPTKYIISGLGWTLNNDGYHTYYRLDAYCDKFLEYHNKISEELIEPASSDYTPHDEEVDLSDINGEELKIGDNVYAAVSRLYTHNNQEEINIDTGFVFAGEGTIVGMKWFKEGTKMKNGQWLTTTSGVRVNYKKHFLFSGRDENSQKYDSSYDSVCDEHIHRCMKCLPKNYAELYVRACIENKFNPCEAGEFDKHDVWLKHLGIYDDVIKLYNEVKSKKKTIKKKSVKKTDTKKKETKLDKLVGQLSEKEKEELLKMLQK